MKKFVTKIKRLSPRTKSAIGNVFYPLLSLAIVLAIWAIAAASKDNTLLMPAPAEVLSVFFDLLGEKTLWNAVGQTLLRTFIAFIVSFSIAFALAVLGGLFKPLHRIISPIVGILRAAPTMAVILIIMIWVDFNDAPKYIGFLIAFPILYPSFYTAISGVDKDLTEMTKIYKVKWYDKITALYIPLIAPSVFDVSKTTISLTLKVIIASEVLCYTKNSVGLGMLRANLTFEVAQLLAWTVLAIVLSFVLELIVSGCKKLWEVAR